jgi:alkylation response protein AidB-like acyl-CoA dehydrogenase
MTATDTDELVARAAALRPVLERNAAQGEADRAAIDRLVSAHGASSFADSSPMQRIWRDVNTAGRHAVVSPAVSLALYGKAPLGVENDVTDLV